MYFQSNFNKYETLWAFKDTFFKLWLIDIDNQHIFYISHYIYFFIFLKGSLPKHSKATPYCYQDLSWLATTKLVVAKEGFCSSSLQRCCGGKWPVNFSSYASGAFIPGHFRRQDLVQSSQTTLSHRAFVYLWTGPACRVWWKPEMHGVFCAFMSLH